jgi:hypothetical protein
VRALAVHDVHLHRHLTHGQGVQCHPQDGPLHVHDGHLGIQALHRDGHVVLAGTQPGQVERGAKVGHIQILPGVARGAQAQAHGDPPHGQRQDDGQHQRGKIRHQKAGAQGTGRRLLGLGQLFVHATE